MNSDATLDALADAHGILTSFDDLSNVRRSTSPDTKRALLRANGVSVDNDAMVAEALAELRHENAKRLLPREIIVWSDMPETILVTREISWSLRLDGGTDVFAEGRAEDRIDLPSLPSGVHGLTVGIAGHQEDVAVIAAPVSCPSVETMTGQPRIWGVNAALYAMRSYQNGGLGNYSDLAAAAEAFGARGADFIGINPVHSIGWSARDTISPYSPSHRGFLNTSYITSGGIADTASSFGGQEGERIDYSQFTPAHQSRLEALYREFQSDGRANGDFDAFCAERGEALTTFAVFEALCEIHGASWREWPETLQNPYSHTVNAAVEPIADRIRFHKWLQWLSDRQLGEAQARATDSGMKLGLYLDLAVGSRRDGAESWCEQNSIADGVSLGAPPDHLSPDGQNWQLAAYAPKKLAGEKFLPLRRIISETMRHAGVLRIDHVLGMNRSYWIPDDGSPGGYIRQPFDVLLALVAIEAERSGTIVVGEDLGLVPKGFREALAERGLYSYSVLQYERDKSETLRQPDTLRPNSLLCFGTHDTPTLRGFWEGRDIDWWRKLGWTDDAGERKARKQRGKDRETLSRMRQSDASKNDESFAGAKKQVHAAMAASPVAMVSVQLDDLCDQAEAQNLPGTIDEHPNWRRRCSVPVEKFSDELGLDGLGAMMRASGRGRVPSEKEKT